MKTITTVELRAVLVGACMVLCVSLVAGDSLWADTDPSSDIPRISAQATVTITPSAGLHGSISPDEPVTVASGASHVFTAHPDRGYEVDAWLLDGSVVQVGGSTYTVVDVQEDRMIHVTFRQLQYRVTPSAGPHGSISPDEPVPVAFGASHAFTAHPDEGYGVGAWWLDDGVVQVGGDTYTVVDVQEDRMLHVTFMLHQHQVTPSAGPHGSIEPGTTYWVEPGSDLKFTARPATGYKVDTWFLDGSMDQIGGDEYELADIDADHTVRVTFVRLLAYSLGDIDFHGTEDFLTRIVTNNVADPGQPENDRIHVERVEGLDPDPEGVLVMHSLKDLDPTSPSYGRLVNARVKALFKGASENEIAIRFTYLFSTGGPGVELVIYLSDIPALLGHDDPLWDRHYLEVARLPAPPAGRPGSQGSGRLAVFEKVVSTGHLDLVTGIWIELELIEPETSKSVVIDAWGSSIQCYGICLDINWDNLTDVSDFLKVIGECGRPAVGEQACCEGLFSVDGMVDSLDTISWDWALRSRDRLLSLCTVPLVDPDTEMAGMSQSSDSTTILPTIHVAGLPEELTDLLIMGKRGTSVAASKLRDRFYAFGQDGTYASSSAPSLDRCNVRLLKDNAGGLYVVNTESGLVRLGETDEPVVPPGVFVLTDLKEPRYNGSATVYVGIQEGGANVFGRPILDAAFDGDYVYVAPVVVSADGGESYTAAAKLSIQAGTGEPYRIVQLYDDPPLPGDNQYRDTLRELEIDDAGNLYVLNAHCVNESDILWRYAPDGSAERLDLGRPDSDNYCPNPIKMHMSGTASMLYVASGWHNEDNVDTSLIYGYSTQGPLTRARVITIDGMQHIAGITEDATTGQLWILGFNMYSVPEYPNPTIPPFYLPCLANVAPGNDHVQAQSLYDPGSHDLAFPLSIVWTGI